MRPKCILILGGTQDALALAEMLSHRPNVAIVTSLAGVTSEPVRPKGKVHIGGFGGVEGLRAYLEQEEISIVADATHPFATQISSNGVYASGQAGIPYVRLERPEWEAGESDRWTVVETVSDAVKVPPNGARVLLTLGRKDFSAFLNRKDLTILARMIEPPAVQLPENVTVLLARPPFLLEDEKKVMSGNGIEFLVAKNSGGDATSAKLAAARELGVTVIMIRRPEKLKATIATSVEDMVKLIEEFTA